jgi:catechol 2,3-dioxygenase-like lactoylglutathione lyase family enzyme
MNLSKSGLDHVALSVRDLNESLHFYRDLLGLELIRVLECGADSKLGTVVGMPGCAARIAHLRFGSAMLELFQYLDPRGEPVAAARKQADIGWAHFGFISRDVRSDYEALRQAGVRFLSEPVEFRPNVWIVYFYGPDREVCELRQTPAEEVLSDSPAAQ